MGQRKSHNEPTSSLPGWLRVTAESRRAYREWEAAGRPAAPHSYTSGGGYGWVPAVHSEAYRNVHGSRPT
ncbi:hypothetical protein ABIA38_001887 [Embleya sp. AB8]